MKHLDNHILYVQRTCPYCVKVLRFMEANGLSMEIRDTFQPGNRDDLIRIGGKKQVPCLVINGKAMYESNDIVAYLRDYVS